MFILVLAELRHGVEMQYKCCLHSGSHTIRIGDGSKHAGAS
jgi:hypothetical protein